MKDDLPPPGPVPKKRRALEQAPDVYLAVWLADPKLTPGERKRVSQERESRRKRHQRVVLGLLVGPEGVTPKQLAILYDTLSKSPPSEIHHCGVASNVHTICRRFADRVVRHDAGTQHDMLRHVTRVVGLPKEMSVPKSTKTGTWGDIKYAKHRGLPVVVIMPTGERG
jgi:hypothetical protein